MSLLEKLEMSGLEIALEGEDLRIRARELTEEQREFLRRHKEEIKAELAARERPLSERTRTRLIPIVNKLVNDCVSWYRADDSIIEQLNDDALEFVILEFLSKREWYLRQQGTAQ